MGSNRVSEVGKPPLSGNVFRWYGLSILGLLVATVSYGCGSSPASPTSTTPPPSQPSTTAPSSPSTTAPASTPQPSTTPASSATTSSSPSPPPLPNTGFSCESDLQLGPVAADEKKGLCLDDTTFSTCAGSIPLLYPNTDVRVSSLRLFSPWKKEWPEAAREQAWNDLQAYLEKNNAKILLGSQITCDPDSDAEVWSWTKQLISKLGSNRIMGVAIGNELDLLWMKDSNFQTPACIERLWNSSEPTSVLQTFLSWIAELDNAVPGFESVPVTSVWSTYCYAAEPFVDNPKQVMCKTFFQEAIKKFGTRFTFSFNIYPYFDTANHLDPNTKDQCQESLKGKLCFDDKSCFTNTVATQGRIKIRSLLNEMNLPDTNYQLWIGESGWSHPVSSTTQPVMKNCPEWSSNATFVKNYNGWLTWDLTLTDDKSIAPADHVFFFTMRDSFNFGMTEHFGLISKCGDSRCKLQKANTTATPIIRPDKAPKDTHRLPSALSGVVIA